MAITTAQYIEKVFYRVGKGFPEEKAGVFRASIEAALPQALEMLGKLTAASAHPPTRALLQKSFSATLSGGEITLLTQPTLLLEYIPTSGRVTLATVTRPLRWLPHREDLDNPPFLPDYIFYTLFEGKIVVRKHDGTIPSPTALTIVSSYIPAIAEVTTPELEEELIEIGIGLVQGNERLITQTSGESTS